MQDSDPDTVTDSKTIFDVSLSEVFWRNVVAGAGRALGAIILQAIFLIVIVNLFMKQVWPIIEPILGTLQTTTQTLERFTLQ
jgi:hypothetical protein